MFLNLIGNGFYAATKRRATATATGFRADAEGHDARSRRCGGDPGARQRHRHPAEIRDKLFQPFFTTKPTGEGTGLGLSISYDIVTQQHGGTIEVDSEPATFTEFTVRLPRSAAGRTSREEHDERQYFGRRR